jgi:general secretion pathway protein B
MKETPASRQPSAVIPGPAAKGKPATDGRIVKLNELPSEIKNSLPDLKMSAHFYSTDQQARFARVNDKILHEGETLSEDLKVEEINPGGTVFRYKGYRFQININENR